MSIGFSVRPVTKTVALKAFAFYRTRQSSNDTETGFLHQSFHLHRTQTKRVLGSNFPSGVHIQRPNEVRNATPQLMMVASIETTPSKRATKATLLLITRTSLP